MSVARMVESRDKGVVDVDELIEVIEAVGCYGAFRRTQKKECLNLVRKLRLLLPLLEEIKDTEETMSFRYKELMCLESLKKALFAAKKLLKYCNFGSKIYLALETEAIMCRFHSVYDKLSQALEDLPCEEMRISVELLEQVMLLRMQLKRAKQRTDTQDIELAMDMMVLFSKRDHDASADSAILERLANKLGLRTFAELKAETLSVRKLVKERNGRSSESTEQTVYILREFKRIAGLESVNALEVPAQPRLLRCPSLSIPNEFLCPITLEIMSDPVIVATGQTYERESIQKWLEANHRTCPKTGQILGHLSLAPNYAIRNLIQQWCENNSYELPKREVLTASVSSAATELKQEISSLVRSLSNCQLDVKRKVISELRKLSKESPENRVVIANCGGIPPLVKHLNYPESKIQEETVTALLNLSIDEGNKSLIGNEGAIPCIIKILRTSTTPEALENSAAALFSLSMLDENKEIIGSSNGIPPLVSLLKNGTPRGKKDAATALFNLSINQANKTRAIRAGIIQPLLNILKDKNLNMIDEALSILLLLASHPEGQSEIGTLTFIESLVKIIKDGTAKNKECATSLLLALGLSNSSLMLAALQYGVYDHLMEIRSSGTNRAQRKANSLLQHMSKCEHIP